MELKSKNLLTLWLRHVHTPAFKYGYVNTETHSPANVKGLIEINKNKTIHFLIIFLLVLRVKQIFTNKKELIMIILKV